MKIKCSCAHPQQDAMHGAGTRVANPLKTTTSVQVRCTVCAKVHVLGGTPSKGK